MHNNFNKTDYVASIMLILLRMAMQPPTSQQPLPPTIIS